ncbi:NAD(P)H-dependent oxidoreductase [Mangrovitalea sediminis]|uniref:NAD(P)H-dependent oxidoreductase n=1 Tax=Mangrovitalea sediminis TaxID=1982043 RepID=UPI000BE521D5|nr:NAD(P)H-dependent oxidoreductase [Mangrovitalea sediminis]
MNILIVHAHPEPRSFNGAMTRTALETLRDAGHSVTLSDLYALQWNPVSSRANFTTVANPDYLKPQAEEMLATEQDGFAPDIEAELRKLEAADLMIWQFPLWWFGLPAILKGWVDRVFAMGRTYGGGHIYDTGRFRGRQALLSFTTGGPAPAYQKDGFNGDIDAILRPIQRGMLQFLGFDVLASQQVFGPAHMDDAQRTQALADWERRLRAIESEAGIEVGRY